MTKQFDVIVIGAGPAGLLAARQAGTAGCSVALLERKTDIARLDRMCGQTLVSLNDYYFDELIQYNPAGKRISFLSGGLSFPYSGPVKHLYAWNVFSPDGSRLAFGLPEENRTKGVHAAVGLAYDKQILFQDLLDEVQQAGVDVFAGIDVDEVEQTADGVQVSGSGKVFNGRYAVAADGTNSRIARLLGCNASRELYSYLLCKGWYMSNVRFPDSDILISSICYEGPAPGYMFIFPRPYDGQATVAFLALDPRVDLDDVADYFMSHNPFFAPWFSQAEKLQQLASAQYVYSPIEAPLHGRVLLAGDTGACQELENSGAMISGWKAGNAVAAAVKEEGGGIQQRALEEYVCWWKSVYLDACSHEDYIMNFAMPYVLDTAEDFNFLCSLVKEPLPPCWNPYAAIKHLGGLMQQVMPAIQQQRPEMMAKLARMASPMSEILASTTEACTPVREFD